MENEESLFDEEQAELNRLWEQIRGTLKLSAEYFAPILTAVEKQVEEYKMIRADLGEHFDALVKDDPDLKHKGLEDVCFLAAMAAEKAKEKLSDRIISYLKEKFDLEQWDPKKQTLTAYHNSCQVRYRKVRNAPYVMPITLLSNNLQEGLINAGNGEPQKFNVMTAKNGYDVEIFVRIQAGNYPELQSLTELQRQVFESICSICSYVEKLGGTYPIGMTIDDVYSNMPGGGEKASKKSREMILEAWNILRHIDIDSDVTDQYRAMKLISDDETKYLQDYCINAAIMHVESSNHEQVKMLVIRNKPVLLQYAEDLKQIATLSAKYLNVRKIDKSGQPSTLMRMSPERQAMTGYMLRRIVIMRNDFEKAKKKYRYYERKRKKALREGEPALEERSFTSFLKQSPRMLFETIFTAAGVDSAFRQQTADNRQFCIDVLNYYKVSGLIHDFSIVYNGKSYRGIEVYFR